jgi:hypothetical protein
MTEDHAATAQKARDSSSSIACRSGGFRSLLAACCLSLETVMGSIVYVGDRQRGVSDLDLLGVIARSAPGLALRAVRVQAQRDVATPVR